MRNQQFDYSVNILQALLWQYNNATSLQTLLEKKQEWYTTYQSQFWQDWFTNVFDLRTANDFGLSVWSFILDQPLQIGSGPDPVDKPIFGFGAEVGPPESNDNVNFDNGNFANTSNTLNLSAEEKRIVLFLKYYKCVGTPILEFANPFLDYVFRNYPGRGDGKVYILDGYEFGMKIRIIFTFEISSSLIYALKTFDLIPRSSGVKIEYFVQGGPLFGFGAETGLPESNDYVNFDNGALFEGFN